MTWSFRKKEIADNRLLARPTLFEVFQVAIANLQHHNNSVSEMLSSRIES
jgi:hypothetical protein